MTKIFFCCIIIVLSPLIAAQSKLQKLELLKNKTELKATEVEKDLFRIEYPNGDVKIKNTAEYLPSLNKQNYSPTFDSTIIDLSTIDTTLYNTKFKFWRELFIADFPYLLIGDLNNNGKTEIYGFRKNYTDKECIKYFYL